MQALLGLVSLQVLLMSAIDHALEEIIPEDLLSEPHEVESSVVRTEVLDDVPLAGNPAGARDNLVGFSRFFDLGGRSRSWGHTNSSRCWPGSPSYCGYNRGCFSF
jgi:hypothetical protein